MKLTDLLTVFSEPHPLPLSLIRRGVSEGRGEYNS